MKIAGRAVVVAVFLYSSLFGARAARAGDVKGKVSAEGLSSAGGIAAYIDAVPGKKFDPPAQHVILDQRNMKFVPQTVVSYAEPPWIS
jgi:hypothetical protein